MAEVCADKARFHESKKNVDATNCRWSSWNLEVGRERHHGSIMEERQGEVTRWPVPLLSLQRWPPA